MSRYEPRNCTECSTQFQPVKHNHVTCGPVCCRARKLRIQKENGNWRPPAERRVVVAKRSRYWTPPRPGLPCGMEPDREALADWQIRHDMEEAA